MSKTLQKCGRLMRAWDEAGQAERLEFINSTWGGLIEAIQKFEGFVAHGEGHAR